MKPTKPGLSSRAIERTRNAVVRCVFALGVGSAAGCGTRTIVQVQDPSSKETVLVETIERTNYFVAGTSERVFWACTERGDSFICERQCGSRTQYRCPSGFRFHHATASNSR